MPSAPSLPSESNWSNHILSYSTSSMWKSDSAYLWNNSSGVLPTALSVHKHKLLLLAEEEEEEEGEGDGKEEEEEKRRKKNKKKRQYRGVLRPVNQCGYIRAKKKKKKKLQQQKKKKRRGKRI